VPLRACGIFPFPVTWAWVAEQIEQATILMQNVKDAPNPHPHRRSGLARCRRARSRDHSPRPDQEAECQGTPTTIRVVCNNTLTVALNGASSAIKVPHRTSFDAQAVKKQLGVAVSQWDSFMYRMKTLSERKVRTHEAMNYFLRVLCNSDTHLDAGRGLVNERALKKVQAMYEGHGRGAELAAANGTAWGLLCAVTEYVDHEKRARSDEYRLDSAWFGQGGRSAGGGTG
jgi:phage/plasmid-like protein (TIGR03299 family)